MGKYDRIQAQNKIDNDEEIKNSLKEKTKKQLEKEEVKAQLDPSYTPKSYDELYQQNYYNAVSDAVVKNAKNNLGTMGGDVSKGIDSAASIITGIITGDITGGLAGASAPWLAEQIKIHAGDNEVARLTAHAILAGTIAELQGNSGLAGGAGAGAVSGELAAEAILNLYKDDKGKKKDIKDLTEAEKQNISALSQLAAGLAAASMGGDVGDIGASIAASKNAVENNFLGPIDQERLMELRDKRDKKFLSREEKIEMFLLDELDQKGDYLVGKYYKDPNSLTDEQVQRLMESLTRYYQQEEGMIGEEAAKRAVNDLLTGNWGYRAHNYDYPYLSYPEHKELYIDAYWDSIANKSFLEKLFSARPQDENEQYFNKEKAWQKYMEATEWERQVGRPVMNFLPGGVGLVYNTMDTLESANALSDVNRRLNNGEEFNTEMALKLTDAGLTFVPVAGSRLMSKGGTKGTVGGIFNTSALNPNEIRFSQNTVSYNKVERGTDMKYTYDDIVTSMKTNGWKGDPVDVIKMPDGKFTSMDNTRIAAAREAGIDIKANIRNFYDKLSPAEVNRFSDPKKGFVPVSWGDAITGRINKQSGGFSKNNPYGSSTPPRISGKPKD
ncbi:VENN motif pre-toxin domain-containing protein [Gilliamella sp. WF3-4]|uniref:VENN motif pre-toxin domain-containing protein n=1 Tax=Gilliamella sp. WF3-4 TaxID=3120255 RepID=UPI002FF6A399